MADCVLFCAGEFHGLARPIDHGDVILGVDGGLAHLQALSLTPSAVLGDFDSLGYVPEGARVFPVEKDDTDCMLAVRYGLSQGLRRFYIYGGMEGQRLDHTLANLQTLLYLAQNGSIGYLIGKTQVATVITNSTLRFPEGTGTVSVFAMGGAARGVSIQGMKYALENGVLSPDFPLGVSNSLIGKKATVQVEDGSLLVIFPRGEFPEVCPC